MQLISLALSVDAGPEGLMLFSSHKQIRAYFLTSGVYYPVARDLSQVTGVAYDGQHVYWTSMYHGEESISRSLEDGSEREVIITAGLSIALLLHLFSLPQKMICQNSLFSIIVQINKQLRN